MLVMLVELIVLTIPILVVVLLLMVESLVAILVAVVAVAAVAAVAAVDDGGEASGYFGGNGDSSGVVNIPVITKTGKKTPKFVMNSLAALINPHLVRISLVVSNESRQSTHALSTDRVLARQIRKPSPQSRPLWM
ncbi:hypothetical protein PoB_005473100 [Plakobranchus ocellatus]|uniref:Uncharacterized protein n=1 Tax=Plakobranchus ocellatus TaxID=259542 RepID=A0AAV4BYL1_9GAST|nr:hypothetical protein PoB_005473100 [Plakobranchus ocellatus]